MIASLLFLASMAFGQDARDNDVQIWSDVGVTVRMNKQWRLSGESSFRTALDKVDELNNDLGVQYRPAKWLRLGTTYRVALDDFDELRVKHRLGADAMFYVNTDVVKLRFRHRQTYRIKTERSNPKHVVRWRAKAAIKTDSPVEPFLAAEPFLLANLNEKAGIEKWRLTAGANIALGDSQLGVYYRLEEPTMDDKDARIHIVGLSLGFDVKL